MRAGGVVGELLSSIYFQHVAEIAEGGTALVLDVFDAAIKVVVALRVTAPGTEDGKVANGVPKAGAGRCAGRVLELGPEISRQVATDADDELAVAFLGDPKFPSILDLPMDAVAGAPLGTAQSARLLLNGSEVCAPAGSAEAQDILHHEYARLKEVHIAQELLVKGTARIVFNAKAVVRTVHLAGSGEPLAGRTADYHVNGQAGRGTRPDEFGEFFRAESGQILVENERNIREVSVECCNGLHVRVDCGEDGESRAPHSEAKSATAAEQVDACEPSFAGHSVGRGQFTEGRRRL
jgi:hypothetical protein